MATTGSLTSSSAQDRREWAEKEEVEPQADQSFTLQTVDVGKDELLTLHFKKSGHVLELKARHLADSTSVHVSTSQQLYQLDQLSASSVSHVMVPPDSPNGFYSQGSASYHLTVREMARDKTNPGTNIESIHDIEWRQQQMKPRKLLESYKMLSKFRLTGGWIIYCLFFLK